MSVSETAINVGVAGYGMAAQVFHVPLITSTAGLNLAAVSTRRAGEAYAALPGLRVHASAADLCADPDLDLVVIATPNDSHAPLAEMAMRAGKHVVVDKPFALDAQEAAALVDVSHETGRLLSVFQNRRWDGDFLMVRDVIASGRLGRVVGFESHFDRFRPDVPDRWRDRIGPGSGVWYDLGPHLVDQALQLFGLPRSVTLDLAVLRDGGVTDDYVHAVLAYDSLRVILHATTLAAAETPRFAVHGTRASLVVYGLDPQEAAMKAGQRPGGAGWGLGAPDGRIVGPAGEETVARPAGDYPAFYAAMRDAIRGRGAVPVPAEDGLLVMRVLDAGRRSSQEGRSILLAD